MAAQSILDIYDSVEEFMAILVAAELHASVASGVKIVIDLLKGAE